MKKKKCNVSVARNETKKQKRQQKQNKREQT